MSCLPCLVSSLDVTLPRNRPRRSSQNRRVSSECWSPSRLACLPFGGARWPGGSVRRCCLGGVPFLLDLAEVPDGQGHGPGHGEDAGDDEPGLVDVEGGQEVPEPAGQAELLAEEAEDFDGADEQRDEH